MANPWFRMYSEFASDHKVQLLSEQDQRRYVMLLCLRCSNEEKILSDEEIIYHLRISMDDWLATKTLLVDKGLIDSTSRPTAWDKRQYVSDSSTARVAAYRERMKQQKERDGNVSVTPPDTDTDTDTEKSICDRQAESLDLLGDEFNPAPVLRIPYAKILEAYQNKLPSLPQPQILEEDRRRAVKKIWTKDQKYASVDFFERFFDYVSKSPFLMGETRANFTGCNFDWLMKPANFRKIVEGNYHGDKNNA